MNIVSAWWFAELQHFLRHRLGFLLSTFRFSAGPSLAVRSQLLAGRPRKARENKSSKKYKGRFWGDFGVILKMGFLWGFQMRPFK